MAEAVSPSHSDSDQPRKIGGWWKLTTESMHDFNEAAIFSRISDVVIFDLLLRQAELCEMRERFFGPLKHACDQGPVSLSTVGEWGKIGSDEKLAKEYGEWVAKVRPKIQEYGTWAPNAGWWLSC